MNISVENDVLYVRVDMNLTAANAKNFAQSLKDVMGSLNGYSKADIDISGSESIDSMGITFLIAAYKMFKTNCSEITLSGVKPDMLKLFKLMKIDEIFEIRTK